MLLLASQAAAIAIISMLPRRMEGRLVSKIGELEESIRWYGKR